jgi:hypothetical protein
MYKSAWTELHRIRVRFGLAMLCWIAVGMFVAILAPHRNLASQLGVCVFAAASVFALRALEISILALPPL